MPVAGAPLVAALLLSFLAESALGGLCVTTYSDAFCSTVSSTTCQSTFCINYYGASLQYSCSSTTLMLTPSATTGCSSLVYAGAYSYPTSTCLSTGTLSYSATCSSGSVTTTTTTTKALTTTTTTTKATTTTTTTTTIHTTATTKNVASTTTTTTTTGTGSVGTGSVSGTQSVCVSVFEGTTCSNLYYSDCESGAFCVTQPTGGSASFYCVAGVAYVIVSTTSDCSILNLASAVSVAVDTCMPEAGLYSFAVTCGGQTGFTYGGGSASQGTTPSTRPASASSICVTVYDGLFCGSSVSYQCGTGYCFDEDVGSLYFTCNNGQVVIQESLSSGCSQLLSFGAVTVPADECYPFSTTQSIFATCGSSSHSYSTASTEPPIFTIPVPTVEPGSLCDGITWFDEDLPCPIYFAFSFAGDYSALITSETDVYDFIAAVTLELNQFAQQLMQFELFPASVGVSFYIADSSSVSAPNSSTIASQIADMVSSGSLTITYHSMSVAAAPDSVTYGASTSSSVGVAVIAGAVVGAIVGVMIVLVIVVVVIRSARQHPPTVSAIVQNSAYQSVPTQAPYPYQQSAPAYPQPGQPYPPQQMQQYPPQMQQYPPQMQPWSNAGPQASQAWDNNAPMPALPPRPGWSSNAPLPLKPNWNPAHYIGDAPVEQNA